MTLWLADRAVASSRPPLADFSPCLPALGPYRAAVSDLVSEVSDCTATDAECAERIVSRRLEDDEFAAVLEATPDGWDGTTAKLLFEVRNFEPSTAQLHRHTRLAGADLDAGPDRRRLVGARGELQKDSDVRSSPS